jgi:hypothetical protein
MGQVRHITQPNGNVAEVRQSWSKEWIATDPDATRARVCQSDNPPSGEQVQHALQKERERGK